MKNKKIYIIAAISAFWAWISIIVYEASLENDRAINYVWNIKSFDNLFRFIFFGILFFVVINKMYFLFLHMNNNHNAKVYLSSRKILCISFLMNIISWGVCLLCFYPGCAMNDSIGALLGPLHLPVQPLVYQSFIYYFVNLNNKLTNSYVSSFAMLTLFQITTCSLIVAYCCEWMSERFKTKGIYFVIGYYAFMPIIQNYSITIVKDTIFGFFIMLYICCIYDLLSAYNLSNKIWILMLISSICICLLRNNGIVVVASMFVVCFLYSKSKFQVFIVFLISIFLMVTINVYKNNHIKYDESFREASGIMLNQVSAVIKRNGNIDEEEMDFYNKIMPIDEWKKSYAFSFVDKIKFNSKFDLDFYNGHKKQFVIHWLKCIIKNPLIATKSYLYQTSGIWSLFTRVDYTQSIYIKINNNTSDDSNWGRYLSEINLVNKSLLSDSVYTYLSHIYTDLFELFIHISPGLIIWLISVLISFKCMLKKVSIRMLSCLPVYIVFLTNMAATPVSMAYRYSFYLVVSLPIIFMVVINDIADVNLKNVNQV